MRFVIDEDQLTIEAGMSQRWRPVGLAWGAGLVVLGLLAVLLAYPAARHSQWELPIAAAVAAVAWPRAMRRVVPVVLILIGLYGFVLTDYSSALMLQSYTGMYSTLWIFGHSVRTLLVVLPLAYGLLMLGGYLAWRNTDRTSEFGRVVLGRLAEPERRRQLWAFLLVPVVLMAGEMLWPLCWFRGGPVGVVFTIAVLAGTHWLVTRHPGLAARIAVLGLIIIGVVGVVAAHFSAGGNGNAGVSPGHPVWQAGQPWWNYPVNYYTVDGLLFVDNGQPAGLALLQALVFTGFGLALTPVAFPRFGRLVGLSTDGELVRRVERLTESRAVVVDTAAADLRRLERDLHDGAQARLVALGMNLRAAEKLIPVSPDAALALVTEARATSARALTELRELVRGVHPPVLADRGLGDALRALALDTPMKIKADVDLPDRLPAPVETACYFAVAEVLTNAVKHSGARVGQVSATHADGLLRITVTDFGVGGADPAGGTGLAGIERRLAAFDGIVAVSSPVGGPTMVVMEVPCASSSTRTN
jgi:signal transduction histidine kinase